MAQLMKGACHDCLEFEREYLHLLDLIEQHERRPGTARCLQDAASSLYNAWIINQQHRLHFAQLPKSQTCRLAGAAHNHVSPSHILPSFAAPRINQDTTIVTTGINVYCYELAEAMLSGAPQPSPHTSKLYRTIRATESLDVCQVRVQHEPGHRFEVASQTTESDGTNLDLFGDATDKDEDSAYSSDELDQEEHENSAGSVVTTDGSQDVFDLEPNDDGRYDGKFMVCDHCHGNGLLCNEAGVCDQCIFYEQPCVHHWCRDSKCSKNACQNPECRYVHKDSFPRDGPGQPTIVLHGRLLPYLVRGRVPAKSCLNYLTSAYSEKLAAVGERQRQGRASSQAGVETGLGSLKNLYWNCDRHPGELDENHAVISASREPMLQGTEYVKDRW